MFSKNEKKKKGPALFVGIGALAVYGAYSAVSKIKSMTVDKMSCLMSKMRPKRKDSYSKDSCGCESDTDTDIEY